MACNPNGTVLLHALLCDLFFDLLQCFKDIYSLALSVDAFKFAFVPLILDLIGIITQRRFHKFVVTTDKCWETISQDQFGLVSKELRHRNELAIYVSW